MGHADVGILNYDAEAKRIIDLEADNARLAFQAAEAKLDRDVAYIRHRPLKVSGGKGATSDSVPSPDDGSMVRRIIDAYRAAGQSELQADGSWWFMQIADIRRPEHEIVAAGKADAVRAMLRDPLSNNLFYGFDNLAKDLAQPGDGWPTIQGALCYDSLLTLAEAVGAVRLENPEAPIREDVPDVEDILQRLDEAFGFRVEFPNPFPGEVGLRTSRGIASYRCFQAIYQAWRIALLAPKGSVAEIGGGLGRTAYYAKKFGVRDYVIVDLPLTGVAQAYFLMRTGVAVRLFGEAPTTGVRIVPPSAFYGAKERYDLIVNVDSFTEMAPETARRYVNDAARQSGRLLSINHEHNSHRMYDLLNGHSAVVHATRAPYWMRRGYVEELATFKGGPSSSGFER